MGPPSPALGAPRVFDALRASAALGVLGYHVMAAGGGTLEPLDALFAHGFRGVVVFFVLSGYLVSRPFMVRRVALPGYLLRRAARIMPAYLVALVGITLLTGDRLFPTHPLAYYLSRRTWTLRCSWSGPWPRCGPCTLKPGSISCFPC